MLSCSVIMRNNLPAHSSNLVTRYSTVPINNVVMSLKQVVQSFQLLYEGLINKTFQLSEQIEYQE